MTDAQVTQPETNLSIERQSSAMTPTELLRIAVTQNADIDKLTKLMDLQERFEANEARKAYNAAMKQFKANPPEISKNKRVDFGNTHYAHTTLDHACDIVIPALSSVGISHRWKVTQDKEFITVTCILTHEMGHSEETQMMGAPDNSGSKNSIQAIGSTTTYLQRYTLFAACGLAASNDSDGFVPNTPMVETEKLEEYLRQMTEVETLEQLQIVFKKCYKEASEMQDKKAMSIYIKAKDARKKAIDGSR